MTLIFFQCKCLINWNGENKVKNKSGKELKLINLDAQDSECFMTINDVKENNNGENLIVGLEAAQFDYSPDYFEDKDPIQGFYSSIVFIFFIIYFPTIFS